MNKAAAILSNLIYYPIKGCRGFEVEERFVERMGLRADRRMMIVTAEGKFLTQREQPRLALVTPQVQDEALTLAAPGFDSIQVAIHKTGTPWHVDIWKSKGVASIDQGDAAADWFSEWLGTKVRLVHFADGYKRLVSQDYAVNPDDHTGFADGYPILLTSEDSLGDLNKRLESPVPMDRFRPNIVVRGGEPFGEDQWKRIRIGEIELAVVKACARCVVTTIDKETLETSREPLKTLATFRRHPRGVLFGQNLIPLNLGTLKVGMPVEVAA